MRDPHTDDVVDVPLIKREAAFVFWYEFSLVDSIKRVAYITAGGVPIAVPVFWSQYVSPKVKTLFFITIPRASDSASVEMPWKNSSRWWMKLAISCRAAVVGMFV